MSVTLNVEKEHIKPRICENMAQWNSSILSWENKMIQQLENNWVLPYNRYIPCNPAIQLQGVSSRTAVPKVRSQTSSKSSITCKLIRNAKSLGPTESETLGMGPSNLCFNKSSGEFWCMLMSENYYTNECSYENAPGDIHQECSLGPQS